MFYKISPSTVTDIIGTNSGCQSETAIYPVTFDDPLNIWKWNFVEIPDYVPLPIPKVKSKAKFTDLMAVYFTGSGGRLTISEKLKKILEKGSHGNIQFLSLEMVQNKKRVTNYWLTNILTIDNESCVNYKLSLIQQGGFIIEKNKTLHFEDHTSFIHTIDNLKFEDPMISIYNLILNKGIKYNLIVIKHLRGGMSYFVSEQLKEEIEEAGCTGIIFELIEQA